MYFCTYLSKRNPINLHYGGECRVPEDKSTFVCGYERDYAAQPNIRRDVQRTEFYQLGKSTNEGQPEMGNNKFILLRELRGSKGLRQTAYADVYAESTRYPNAR